MDLSLAGLAKRRQQPQHADWALGPGSVLPWPLTFLESIVSPPSSYCSISSTEAFNPFESRMRLSLA